MRRFVFEGWVPQKLAVSVEVPNTFDMDKGRAKPQSANEIVLEEDKKEVAIQLNESDVQALMAMGFPRVRCERAILATGNQGAEMASGYLFEHMEDPALDVPIPKPQSSKQSAEIPADLIQSLSEMGFTPAQAKKALIETQMNMERAVEWLFSHADEPISEESSSSSAPKATPMEIDTGSSKYRLMGFIVHLGPSVHSGHYVAYLYKDNQWIQFNDRKVFKSKQTPTGSAYMYFFAKV